MNDDRYIPALSYHALTPLYDTVVGWTTRERLFKDALVEHARITAGHSVLDLGCGTGTLALLIHEQEPQAGVVGIDGDSKILCMAKKKARHRNVAVRYVQAMSFDLPYEDESFDRVVSSLFFHHLSEKSKGRSLAEARRVLKSDGELHIADWGKPANLLMKLGSRFIQVLDGSETTKDNFEGRLPDMVVQEGFVEVEETDFFNSLFGTIRLLKAVKET